MKKVLHEDILKRTGMVRASNENLQEAHFGEMGMLMIFITSSIRLVQPLQ